MRPTLGLCFAIWLAQSSGISAEFEIPTCENYKTIVGSVNK